MIGSVVVIWEMLQNYIHCFTTQVRYWVTVLREMKGKGSRHEHRVFYEGLIIGTYPKWLAGLGCSPTSALPFSQKSTHMLTSFPNQTVTLLYLYSTSHFYLLNKKIKKRLADKVSD